MCRSSWTLRFEHGEERQAGSFLAKFELGERAVLVRHEAEPGCFSLVGESQARSALTAGPICRRDPRRAKPASTKIGPIPEAAPCAMLSALRSRKELIANRLRSIRRRQSRKVRHG
jgi:hypothetical protein